MFHHGTSEGLYIIESSLQVSELQSSFSLKGQNELSAVPTLVSKIDHYLLAWTKRRRGGSVHLDIMCGPLGNSNNNSNNEVNKAAPTSYNE